MGQISVGGAERVAPCLRVCGSIGIIGTWWLLEIGEGWGYGCCILLECGGFEGGFAVCDEGGRVDAIPGVHCSISSRLCRWKLGAMYFFIREASKRSVEAALRRTLSMLLAGR